ncbi:MAG: ion channel, partial [Verrucomicrobiia bacterium]
MSKQILAIIGLALLNAAIHAFGLLILLYWQTKQWPKIEAGFCPRRNLTVLMTIFSVIVGLHLAEICVWAGFYLWQECFPDFETCVYFSTLTYSTLGYGDVLLPREWRLTGSVESIIGVLLMGWSA